MTHVQHVDIEQLLADQPPRTNFNILFVDGRVALRVARILGTFPHHVHPDHDKVWFVYRGGVRIRTESEDTDVRAGQAARIPAGIAHRTQALEPNSIVMILNSVGFRTNYLEGDTDLSAGYRELDVAADAALGGVTATNRIIAKATERNRQSETRSPGRLTRAVCHQYPH